MKKLIILLVFVLSAPFAYAQGVVGRKPTTVTATLTNSSTEVQVDLSSLNRPITKLQIKCRTSDAIRISYESGGTSSNYTTLPAGQTYYEDELIWLGIIYLKADTGSNLTAEVEYWQ